MCSRVSKKKKLKENLIRYNDLDIELYDFAKKLFFDRLRFYNINFMAYE